MTYEINSSDLNNLTIGVLNSEMEKVNSYLYNFDATYSPYESVDMMVEEFKKEDTKLNAIALRKTIDLKGFN